MASRITRRSWVATLDALVDHTPVRLLLFLGLTVWYFSVHLESADRVGDTFDHRYFYAFDEITRNAIVEEGAVPLWNPYVCGGIPHLGNPAVPMVLPTLPLTLVFGAAIGWKLMIIAMFIVGLEGCYRLARHLGADPFAALIPALVFVFCGRMAFWIRGGQHFFGIELIPWILLMTIRAYGGDRRAVVWGGLFMAWMLGTVALYPVLWCPFTVGIWSVAECVTKLRQRVRLRSALAPLVAPVVMAALGFALQGPRLLPMFEVFAGTPRLVEVYPDTTTVEQLRDALVKPGGIGHLGWVAVTLGGMGLVAGSRWRVRLFIMVAVLGLLALGQRHGHGLWDLLTHLPVYRNGRYAMRLTAMMALPLGIAAGLFVAWGRRVLDRSARGLGLVLAIAAIAAVAVDLLPANKRILGNPYVVDQAQRVEQSFAQARGNQWENQLWPRIDRGSIACFDATPWRTSAALRGDLPQEERLEDPSAGTVRRERWTANEITVRVDLHRAARLLVNQNYDRGWHTSVGDVGSADGLLSVDLPVGRHDVVLRYRPPSFWLGLGLCAAAAILCIRVLWRTKSGGRFTTRA